MLSPCCLCVCERPLLTSDCLNQCAFLFSVEWSSLYETWYVYYGSWAHLNSVFFKSLPLVCVPIYVCPIVARQRLSKNPHIVTQRLGKNLTENGYIRNNRRIVWRVVFCAFRAVSRKVRCSSQNFLYSIMILWEAVPYDIFMSVKQDLELTQRTASCDRELMPRWLMAKYSLWRGTGYAETSINVLIIGTCMVNGRVRGRWRQVKHLHPTSGFFRKWSLKKGGNVPNINTKN
jgi:hypothetical protein